VSKRVLDDISTVAAGIALDLDPAGNVDRLQLAYGGVAATPLRALAVERLATGKPWSEDTLNLLVKQLEGVGTPLDDHRGSAAYRRAMMGRLLEKFFHETRGSAL
jgi:xanthine dehydrogenase small subunit